MTETAIADPGSPPAAPEARTYRYFCAGKWREADGTFDDLEPFTGKLFARIGACTREDAKAAVDAASGAFAGWAQTTPATKAALFLEAADVVKRRSGEIAELLIRETGAGRLFANFQQGIVVQMLQQAANWVYLPQGEVLRSDMPGTYLTAVRRPLGVVASFTPWNGANVLGWRALLCPLIAGNTVVLKPSELAPVSAGLIMGEILDEAGFPPGVVNIVTHAPGAAAPIADEVFENPAVRCINFIGSVKTARMLAERAGRLLKRSVMELGGYNPLIVCDDIDLDYAARVSAFSAFFHQGQICMNARKLLVDRKVLDEFLEKLIAKTQVLPMGDPAAPDTIIGPLITPDAVNLVHERVQEAVAKGAHLLTGGEFTGQVYAPTILTHVPDDAVVSCEETFGPVVVVEPVESLDDAIEIANHSMYGLTAAVLSGDAYRAFDLGSKILAGSVHINLPTVDDEVQAPLGGVRDSGWGRSGPHSIADFTDLITMNVQTGQRQLPLA
jgi:acyl-CoA reductase-like NAD-dependent aldehyde dehydrogenase